MPLVVAIGALAFRRWRLAAALVLVVPLKLALERVVKLLVQRERPGTTVPDAVLRGVHPAGLSFVSGHAITFAIAGLLALVLPRRWGVVAFVLATLNAVARVYLGRTTRWMWSVGRRSAWRSRLRWTWCCMWPVTARAAGAGSPPRQAKVGSTEARTICGLRRLRVVASRSTLPDQSQHVTRWQLTMRAWVRLGSTSDCSVDAWPLVLCAGHGWAIGP
jgi:hypothetical protein